MLVLAAAKSSYFLVLYRGELLAGFNLLNSRIPSKTLHNETPMSKPARPTLLACPAIIVSTIFTPSIAMLDMTNGIAS